MMKALFQKTFSMTVNSGMFGTMSKVDKEFHSMLFSNGTLFEHGNIESKFRVSGDVLIKQITGGFEIDSPQPFILTIPITEKDNGVLEVIIGDEKILFNGEVMNKDKIRLATFELPALSRAKLTAK